MLKSSTALVVCYRCLALLAAALLAACGGAPAGDSARGARLFSGAEPIAGGGLPACSTCHAITSGDGAIGPSLAGVASRAGATVPGQTADAYLRESITAPDAYLAGGFQEGIMNRDYAVGLSAQQIDDLVAYMLTLR